MLSILFIELHSPHLPWVKKKLDLMATFSLETHPRSKVKKCPSLENQMWHWITSGPSKEFGLFNAFSYEGGNS